MVIGDEPVARDGESDWYETVVGTSKRQEYTCSDGDWCALSIPIMA